MRKIDLLIDSLTGWRWGKETVMKGVSLLSLWSPVCTRYFINQYQSLTFSESNWSWKWKMKNSGTNFVRYPFIESFWAFLCDLKSKRILFKSRFSILLLKLHSIRFTNLLPRLKFPNPSLISPNKLWFEGFLVQLNDTAFTFRTFGSDELLFNGIAFFDVLLEVSIVFYWFAFQSIHHLSFYFDEFKALGYQGISEDVSLFISGLFYKLKFKVNWGYLYWGFEP